MKRTLLVLLAVTSFSFSALAQSHPLLRDVFGAPDRAGKARRVAAIRSRFVQADVTPLKPKKDVNRGQQKKLERLLSVALFDDARVQVVLDTVERTAVDSYSWTGRIDGDPRSSVIVAVKDEAMTATFTTADRFYEIRPVPDGLHEAVEVDRTVFPNETDPQIPLLTAAAPGDVVAAADGETVDLLIAYTHVVREGLGSTAAAQALATSIITTTNTAYVNSGVTMRVRLVGTAEVQYDDQLTDSSTTLSRLTSPSDGQIDTLHALRNSTGADAVSLLVYYPTDTSTCGIAWLMTSPSASFAQYGFSVVRDDCAVGNLSFPHELGHNFGLAHDRNNASGASRSYAYGYQHPQRLFRTIMAYNCPNGGCPRVPHFSNPSVLYSGAPTGILYTSPTAADNARALNNNASFIAAWRATVVTPPPGTEFTDNPLVAGETEVKTVHITELREAINDLRASKGLAAAAWSSLTGAEVRASHIAELRTALTPALSPTVPVYTNTTLSGVDVKAVHIQELRNYLD